MATITSTAGGSSHIYTTPGEFQQYLAQQTVLRNRVLSSGIITPLSLNNVGSIHHQPYVNDLTGEARVSSASGADASASSLDAGALRYYEQELNHSWTEADLVSTDTGFPVESYVNGRLAPFWSSKWSQRIGATLDGVANSGSLILSLIHI